MAAPRSTHQPLGLAISAAARFVRTHGVIAALRLILTGVRTLGIRGVIRRAAVDARAREDDERYRASLTPAAEWPSAGPASELAISIVTAVFNTAPESLERCVASVRAQTHSRWQWCICDDGSTRAETIALIQTLATDPRIRVLRSVANGGIVQATNAALAMATGEFVGFLDHDDELAPHALAEVARRLGAEPDLDLIYTDEDKIDANGTRSQPHFKPDWSPELLRSCMYLSHFTVMRRNLIERLGGLRAGTDGAQDYDLALRAATATSRIAHIPQVLYHWRISPESAAGSQIGKPWAVEAGRLVLAEDAGRRGVAADVLMTQAAGHYRVRRRATPSVSVRVVRAGTVDDGPPDEFLVIVDPSVEPMNADWTEALLDVALDPEVGVVSGIVLSDGTIESAGLVLGPGGPRYAFQGEPSWAHGHRSNLLDVRNCASIDSACFMTPRALFNQLGGIDTARWPQTFAIDYSLRVRRAGLRAAVTPHAQLRRVRPSPSSDAVPPEEWHRLLAIWGDELLRDPFYNPNFDQTKASFRLTGGTGF